MDIFDAAKRGHLERVRALVEQCPALVNATDDGGWTSLLYSARGGHAEVARYLLDHGANVHHCDHDSVTALHLACMRGYAGQYMCS